MFGLGVGEIALILAVALIVLGPKKLPAAAKQIGRGLREFRRAASDFQVSLEQEADEQERKEFAEKRRAELEKQRALPTPESPTESDHPDADDHPPHEGDVPPPPATLEGEDAHSGEAGTVSSDTPATKRTTPPNHE